MRTSELGIELIKGHEQLRLTAYLCPADVPTIGYGHTGPDVTRADVASGKTITERQADMMLIADLGSAESAVNKFVTVPLAQHEFDALVCFVFNVGGGAFRSSTLLRLLNQGFKCEVPAQLARWNKASGKILRGLTRRRAEEAVLWAGRRDENATPDNINSARGRAQKLLSQ